MILYSDVPDLSFATAGVPCARPSPLDRISRIRETLAVPLNAAEPIRLSSLLTQPCVGRECRVSAHPDRHAHVRMGSSFCLCFFSIKL